MHRRGLKGRIQRTQEEQLLDRVLLEALRERGTQGRIDFEDPDAVIAVETLGDEAGLSLWKRADLERYPALEAQKLVEQVLASDLGLTLSPEKTHITTYGKGYEFLGFVLKSRSRRPRDKSGSSDHSFGARWPAALPA
jgi:hypothetical protein